FQGDNLMHQSGMFLSGLETSSTTASFALMELAKHEQCQKQARSDILRAISEHGWSYEAMDDMKYLDQCIAETLRLHPSVSTLDRISKDEYRVPGSDIILESGTPIYISLYGLQKDPRFFEDPEMYNPERFRKGEQISDAYLPFGLGPRMCIGLKLGMLHAKMVLSLFLKDYEIYQSPKNKCYLDPRSTFTTAANGIILHLKKIQT
ncbi:probable cytochrome P450 6d5, partial [Fopius arisanus]|uniref:Probable cytochrome P450 6d5 n=1 Tax=Fopius arisanus TaxID=64838 RepID=A0A9R1TZP3_9HYME